MIDREKYDQQIAAERAQVAALEKQREELTNQLEEADSKLAGALKDAAGIQEKLDVLEQQKPIDPTAGLSDHDALRVDLFGPDGSGKGNPA